MFTHVYDFNGEDSPETFVLVQVYLHAAFWHEKPRGGSGHWWKHFVFPRVQGETPPPTDLSGNGRPEVVCHWESRWGWIEPDWNASADP